MVSLKDKVVLITGASSGIGSGAATHLASLGCRLALHGRNADNLQKVVQECEATGLPKDKILIVIGDLSNESVLKDVFGKVIAHYQSLDVLVNNAGVLVKGSVEAGDLDSFDTQMNINVRVPYYLSHLAVPHLKKTKGTIVNVSSVTGLRAFPGIVNYCMSKAAVDQLTRCAALELAEYGIRVNAVNPGVIITELQKRGGLDDKAYAAFLEHSKTTHALGRVGTVDEVAKCIAFLASDESSFITGATIPIDGGRHALCPR